MRSGPLQFNNCVAWSVQGKWGDLAKLGVSLGKPPKLIIW
jgi:hypothetical protein